jgi:hypothetical protein
MYWVLPLEFVRLAVNQEAPDVESGQVVNCKMLKKLCGGDTFKARNNYDRGDTTLTLDTTFLAMGNHSLNYDANDVLETCLELSSVTQFITQEALNAMKAEGVDADELKRYRVGNQQIKATVAEVDWRNAFVYLMLDSYKENAVPIPRNADADDTPSSLRDIKQVVEYVDNKNVGHLIYDKVKTDKVIGETGTYPVNVVYEYIQKYMLKTYRREAIDKKKVDEELKSMNIFKRKNKKREGISRDKMCFFNVEIKELKEKAEGESK